MNINRIVLFWGFFALSATALLSEPYLIEGISYFKVAIGILLASFIVPFMVMKLMPTSNSRTLLLATITLIFLIFTLTKNENLYRDLFGAPGRSNGLLSALNFVYYIIFGVFVRRYFNVVMIFQLISINAMAISTISIALTYLNVGNNSFFASWNLSNPNFQENIDLIAPLIAMGLIAEIYLVKMSKDYLRLLILIPTGIFLIKLGLLQSLISIVLATFVLVLLDLNGKIRGFWVPMILGSGYLLGLWLTSFSFFRSDLSINERREITFFFKDLIQELTLFPQHVDALSDFTQRYPSNQILDDLHNVFLQTTFSFGILVGLLFIYISLKPFWINSLEPHERSGYLAIYTVFFISLFVGISSPNYIYFGAVLIGLSFKFPKHSIQKNVSSLKQSHNLTLGVATILVFIPVVFQAGDYSIRKEISGLTLAVQANSTNTDGELKRLNQLILRMPDSGYRYLVARNFYVIGNCADGDRVLNLMTETNPMETRISKLAVVRTECYEFNSKVGKPS
jgi:hypothetical protein